MVFDDKLGIKNTNICVTCTAEVIQRLLTNVFQ